MYAHEKWLGKKGTRTFGPTIARESIYGRGSTGDVNEYKVF
jgi:hypothetical protein